MEAHTSSTDAVHVHQTPAGANPSDQPAIVPPHRFTFVSHLQGRPPQSPLLGLGRSLTRGHSDETGPSPSVFPEEGGTRPSSTASAMEHRLEPTITGRNSSYRQSYRRYLGRQNSLHQLPVNPVTSQAPETITSAVTTHRRRDSHEDAEVQKGTPQFGFLFAAHHGLQCLRLSKGIPCRWRTWQRTLTSCETTGR